MAIFDKLMFWKKGEDLPPLEEGKDFGLDAGAGLGGQENLGLGASDLGLPGAQPPTEPGFGQNAPFGAPQAGFMQPAQAPRQMAPPGFATAPPITPQPPLLQEFTIVGKDIELLSYKIDTIKAALDMVNQRLANIERLAMHEAEKKRGW